MFTKSMALGAGVIATALMGVAVAPTSARAGEEADPAAAARQALENPSITWGADCSKRMPADDKLNKDDDELYKNTECGDITVPLDYTDLSKGTLTLMVSRQPAEDKANRIGSLFTNPGGPGGPATPMAPWFAKDLGEQVRERFDVVAVAPRGVEGNEKAECRQADLPKTDFDVFPMSMAEIKQKFAHDKALADSCSQEIENGNKILEHMTTADVARDMDLARRAVGDEKLTYYGISYGTYLGATYASLFPDKIRAMVVDGVVDPVGWATGRSKKQGETETVDERLASGLGAKEALLSAITTCEKAGEGACPVAPTIRDDWRKLSQTLRAHPVRISDKEVLRYDVVTDLVMSALYVPETTASVLQVIHELAGTMEAAEASDVLPADTPKPVVVDGRAAKEQVRKLIELDRHARQANPALASRDGDNPFLGDDSPEPEKLDVSFQAVECPETASPGTERGIMAVDDRAWGETGGFGQLWNWQSSVCQKWPVTSHEDYRGPFNKPTSTPVMIIGNDHDPATPLLGATSYRRILPTSRLIRVKDGFGHGALNLSRCVDDARTAYLVDGRVPEKDLTCTPDKPLFQN